MQHTLSKYTNSSDSLAPSKPGHRHRRSKITPCTHSVEECPHIARTIFMLKYYELYLNYKRRERLYDDDDMKKYPSSMTQIISCLDKYSRTKLMDDYLHVKKCHHDDEYELSQYIKSQIKPCTDTAKFCINRNRENNEIYRNLSNKTRRDLYLIPNDMKDGSIEELVEINIQQYLDMIHCTLRHQLLSDNMNNKFTTHLVDDRLRHNGFNDTASADSRVLDDDEKTINSNYAGSVMSAANPYIGGRRGSMMNGGGAESVASMSILNDLGDLGSDYGDVDDNYFYGINENKYKFGDVFTYWNTKFSDYIGAKYNDLKTELTTNNIDRMSSDDYNCIYEKAKDFLETETGKNMTAKRQFSWMYKSVKYGQKITIDHIIAVMIHTNYQNLRDNLINNGCKRINQNESFDELKKRHCEIANFCRLLKEAIFCFGDAFTDRSRLYHGINCKLMFNKVDFSFNIPISTTIKYSIAPHTASSGICIKFGKPVSNQKNYYLDVSDISQFPDEKERIVYGGEPLGFLDIIYNGQSHSEHIMSLRLYQQIIEGMFDVKM